MGCGSLRRCKSTNSLSANETKVEDTVKEYKVKIEKKKYIEKIEKKQCIYKTEKKERIHVGIDKEELQRVNENLFIVGEVNSYLEESPINMQRFKSQAELPRKFSELSRLARKCQKGE